jgi:hypothetical protein
MIALRLLFLRSVSPGTWRLFRITTEGLFICNYLAPADVSVGFLGPAFTVKAHYWITGASFLVFASTRQPGGLFFGGLFIL